MIRRPAPAVNPTITVCEMKFTSAPEARDAHRELEEAHDQREREDELDVVGALPGAASGAIVANTASEIALVGPEIWCHDEPHSAATTAGTIAQ